jgi:hypothetical protein
MEKVHYADSTELHAEPGRFEVAIWRAERASPTRIFRCTMGVHAVPTHGDMHMVTNSIQKRFGVEGWARAPWGLSPSACGARAAQNCSCHFWCNLRFSGTFFSRTFPKHDNHHRSPRQIIIHSEHENSRVGQIASRSDRDRQGHSIRRAAQPAPFTTHFCSSHTCPSSFDQLRPACPSLAGISPVSRSISPVSHRD